MRATVLRLVILVAAATLLTGCIWPREESTRREGPSQHTPS